MKKKKKNDEVQGKIHSRIYLIDIFEKHIKLRGKFSVNF